MMVQCRDTGVWYDPDEMLERILCENEDVLRRLRDR